MYCNLIHSDLITIMGLLNWSEILHITFEGLREMPEGYSAEVCSGNFLFMSRPGSDDLFFPPVEGGRGTWCAWLLFQGGGQLNVDCKFDPISTVESTVIFRNSCRFVDRFFASKSCRL